MIGGRSVEGITGLALALALPLPKVFGALFFDLNVREPRVCVIVPVAVLLLVMCAAYVPARRAAHHPKRTAVCSDFVTEKSRITVDGFGEFQGSPVPRCPTGTLFAGPV
jgi:hypothetical protein